MVETEVNSANDNPLLDVDREEFLHGGNFYGGHVAGAMDALKPIIANIAGLIDRQVALLVDIKTNHGLPSNLSGAVGNNLTISHGFKALQISISAMTAEAMKLTMPASVFSRSTECHNQDIVSMGTIAARDALRILELTEQCLAGGLIVVTQAIDLRLRDGELIDKQIGDRVQNTVNMTRKVSPFLVEDRTLENELRELTSMIQRGAFQFNESLEP
jgi:histidine ammonia-lyase